VCVWGGWGAHARTGQKKKTTTVGVGGGPRAKGKKPRAQTPVLEKKKLWVWENMEHKRPEGKKTRARGHSGKTPFGPKGEGSRKKTTLPTNNAKRWGKKAFGTGRGVSGENVMGTNVTKKVWVGGGLRQRLGGGGGGGGAGVGPLGGGGHSATHKKKNGFVGRQKGASKKNEKKTGRGGVHR